MDGYKKKDFILVAFIIGDAGRDDLGGTGAVEMEFSATTENVGTSVSRQICYVCTRLHNAYLSRQIDLGSISAYLPCNRMFRYKAGLAGQVRS